MRVLVESVLRAVVVGDFPLRSDNRYNGTE